MNPGLGRTSTRRGFPKQEALDGVLGYVIYG